MESVLGDSCFDKLAESDQPHLSSGDASDHPVVAEHGGLLRPRHASVDAGAA